MNIIAEGRLAAPDLSSLSQFPDSNPRRISVFPSRILSFSYDLFDTALTLRKDEENFTPRGPRGRPMEGRKRERTETEG